jgi:hypothetical protein
MTNIKFAKLLVFYLRKNPTLNSYDIKTLMIADEVTTEEEFDKFFDFWM